MMAESSMLIKLIRYTMGAIIAYYYVTGMMRDWIFATFNAIALLIALITTIVSITYTTYIEERVNNMIKKHD